MSDCGEDEMNFAKIIKTQMKCDFEKKFRNFWWALFTIYFCLLRSFAGAKASGVHRTQYKYESLYFICEFDLKHVFNNECISVKQFDHYY